MGSQKKIEEMLQNRKNITIVTWLVGFIYFLLYYWQYNINITAYLDVEEYLVLGFYALLFVAVIVTPVFVGVFFAKKYKKISAIIFLPRIIMWLFIRLIYSNIWEGVKGVGWSLMISSLICQTYWFIYFVISQINFKKRKTTLILISLAAISSIFYYLTTTKTKPEILMRNSEVKITANNKRYTTSSRASITRNKNSTLSIYKKIWETKNYIFIQDTKKQETTALHKEKIDEIVLCPWHWCNWESSKYSPKIKKNMKIKKNELNWYDRKNAIENIEKMPPWINVVATNTQWQKSWNVTLDIIYWDGTMHLKSFEVELIK